MQPVPSPAQDSPLWVITQQPLLHEFVADLTTLRDALAERSGPLTLEVSRSRLHDVHGAFDAMVRRGERRLHRLSELIATHLLGPHDLRAMVVAELPASRERLTIDQSLTREELYGLTDLALGTRLLGRVRFRDGGAWREPRLVSNVVEYLPVEENPWGVHKVLSRIKAEEELWNKVVDEIFDLDALVRRDKELRHLSRYVKDVFGLKVVAADEAGARRIHEHVLSLRFSDGELHAHHVPADDTTRLLHVVETKDYLGPGKKSGWRAMKSVVGWWDRVFEIQVQPMHNFFRERERLTTESHDAFKQRREKLRDAVAEQVPLMAFFRVLVRWLFDEERGEAPSYPGLTVVLVD